jgi:ankyrin repeat protein
MRALPPRGSESLVSLLVRAGADVNARDCRGKTVLDIAQERGSSPQCQQILVNAGARSGAKQSR